MGFVCEFGGESWSDVLEVGEERRRDGKERRIWVVSYMWLVSSVGLIAAVKYTSRCIRLMLLPQEV